MENWKERFEYIYVIEENKGEKYLRKYDHTTIVEELEYFISQELDKAREEGRESIIAELSISENMEKIEDFFRVAPIDYDDKCSLWREFLTSEEEENGKQNAR